MKTLIGLLIDLFGSSSPHLTPLIDESQDDSNYDLPAAEKSSPISDSRLNPAPRPELPQPE